MREAGTDISGNRTRDVFAIYKSGIIFNYAVTVCDGASAERCPIFPGVIRRLHWSFTDPSSLVGSFAEKLTEARRIRGDIRAAVTALIEEHSA